MSNLKGYHVKHRRNFNDFLDKAELVAKYAVANRRNKKLLSSKYVKDIGLPSAISNQILRKYGNSKNIKEVTNINIVVPNQKVKRILIDGNERVYNSIGYESGIVTLKALDRLTFRWNPGREVERIQQVEINAEKFMITAKFKDNPTTLEYHDVLGIDLNCGIGRHIVNMANLKTQEVVNLGKQAPNIRKKYFKKRSVKGIKKKFRVMGDKEKRIMKDFDHKISRKVVDYALQNKLKIVMEDLKGIRTGARRENGVRRGNGFRARNRVVNSWSFYRLQQFIEYKAKERGIPVERVNPHYTSQECSYCGILGMRSRDLFVCKNRNCQSFNISRHADVNAAYNVGKRSLQLGGRAR